MNDTLLALFITGLAFVLYGTLRLLFVAVVCLSRSVRRPESASAYWQYGE